MPASPIRRSRKPAATLAEPKFSKDIKAPLGERRQKAEAPRRHAAEAPAAAPEANETHAGAQKLQKMLAAAGLGSRREMETWITAGRVSVNGITAALGERVSPGDRVLVDKRPVKLGFDVELPRVLIYHKQEGEIVSRDDPKARKTVFDALPRVRNGKWVAIGRLDFNTEGLLIFTTSGELANRLMHPSFEVEREYTVRIMGELSQEQMKSMTAGIELEDGMAYFERIAEMGGEGSNRWYQVIIKEGRNREVRRMFEKMGMMVSRLIRVRFGMVNLPPRVKRGQMLELESSQVAAILKWVGLPVPEQLPQNRPQDKKR
ncbi:pseudouridine synthase [Sulfuriferula sp. AH1]|uniref:pseudouridine synthase n=1 Tax=Sulfuriferula sp. AH1 TaxID=1985873 RepID=UPI000B3B8D39|nr:pseudouridine synthase [Sulfuriferula sp. AH1]